MTAWSAGRLAPGQAHLLDVAAGLLAVLLTIRKGNMLLTIRKGKHCAGLDH